MPQALRLQICVPISGSQHRLQITKIDQLPGCTTELGFLQVNHMSGWRSDTLLAYQGGIQERA